jgi:hypothetical protein
MASIISGFLGLTVGLIFLYSGISNHIKKRKIQDMPTSKISAAAVGLVEIKGRVQPYESTVISISGQKGVYLKYHLSQHKMILSESYWETLDEDEKRVKFYIKDASGKVLIDPSYAEFDLTDAKEHNLGLFYDNPRFIALLNKMKIRHKGILGEKRFRYTEQFIPIGKQLYVMGYSKLGGGMQKEKLTISDKKEEEMVAFYGWATTGSMIIGTLVTIFYIGYIVYAYGIR